MRSSLGLVACVLFISSACSSSSAGGADSAGGAGGDEAGGSGGSAGGEAGSTGGNAQTGGGGGTASGVAGQGGGGASGAAGAGTGGMAGAGGVGGKGGMAGAAGGTTGTGGMAAGASGTGVFVAVGENSVVLRSTDLGLTWQAGANIPDGHTLDNLAYGKGEFFGGTHNNLIYSSADGMGWQKIATPLGQWVGGVAFGNNVYVAVGGYGQAWYSADALSWTLATGRDCSAARSVAFGAGTFTLRTDFADPNAANPCLDSNNWLTSTDGKSWVKTLPQSAHADAVVYCGDAFKDRKNCTLPAGKGVSSVEGGGIWVAVVNGAIQRLPANDGASWQVIGGTSKQLKAVAFAPTR